MEEQQNKRTKEDPYDETKFQALFLPHHRMGVWSLVRNNLVEDLALKNHIMPNLFKLDYKIYLKFMRDTQRVDHITQEEIDLVLSYKRPQQIPTEQSGPKPLCELARKALCKNEGWEKSNECLVGGGMDIVNELLDTQQVISMRLGYAPKPTVATQQMLVHGIETYCTSCWTDDEKTIVRLDHPSKLEFYLEVNIKDLIVERGRWYEIDILRCILRPPIGFKVQNTGKDIYKVIINEQNYVVIDINKIESEPIIDEC